MLTSPPAVSFLKLDSHGDDRGVLTEVFRNEWLGEHLPPVQWNFVRSRPRVLRGVHVHVHHVDYVLVLRGTMHLGLCDLREGTPGFMQSRIVELRGDELTLVTVPTGMAHGFYFSEPSEMLYSVTHYWDPVLDELGCVWNDPALGLNWPERNPILSRRDQEAPPLSRLLDQLRQRGDRSW